MVTARVSARLALFVVLAVASPEVCESQSAPVRWSGSEVRRVAGGLNDLSDVGWVVAFADGSVAVGLPREGAIRRYGPTGGAWGQFGRNGEGPGEFRAMGVAGRLGDTLWVFDAALRRVTYLYWPRQTPPKLIRTAPVPTPGSSPESQVAIVGTLRAVLEDGQLLFLGAEGSGVDGPARRRPLLFVTDSLGKETRRLPRFAEAGDCEVPYRSGTRWGSVGILFCAEPLMRQSPDGKRAAVIISNNASSQVSTITIRSYLPDGTLAFERRLQVPARPIPRALADSLHREALAAARTREAKAARSQAQVPPAYPPVVDAIFTDAGGIWVAITGTDSTRVWLALDRGGTRQADVLLPKGFRPVAVVANHVIGVEFDEDGFTDLVWYRVGLPAARARGVEEL